MAQKLSERAQSKMQRNYKVNGSKFVVKTDANSKYNLYRIVKAKQPGAMEGFELLVEEHEFSSLLKALQGFSEIARQMQREESRRALQVKRNASTN